MKTIKFAEPIKKWLRFFSPFFIAIILFIIGIIDGLMSLKESGGWSYIVIIYLVPATLVLYLCDRISKFFIKDLNILWIVQSVLLLFGFLILYLNQ